MINANELRIGNWVNSKVDGISTPAQIYKIDANERIANYMALEGEYITPIPLTPEILEKCGFVHKSTWELKTPDGLNCISWDGTTLLIYDIDWDKGSGVIIYTKHLHQLQNLYFALTGQELTINLC